MNQLLWLLWFQELSGDAWNFCCKFSFWQHLIIIKMSVARLNACNQLSRTLLSMLLCRPVAKGGILGPCPPAEVECPPAECPPLNAQCPSLSAPRSITPDECPPLSAPPLNAPGRVPPRWNSKNFRISDYPPVEFLKLRRLPPLEVLKLRRLPPSNS